MKIAIAFNHLNPGGITSYIRSLCLGLKERGHQIYLVTAGGSAFNEISQHVDRSIIAPIQTSSEINPVLLTAHRKIHTFLKEVSPQIFHSNSRVTQVLAAASAKKIGMKRVFTCHGFFKTRLGRYLFPMWGDRLIAISPQVREHLISQWKVQPQKIDLITHGISILQNNNEVAKQQARAKYNIPSDCFVIGAFGRYSSVKGYDILIEATTKLKAHIPNLLVVIAGHGEEYLKYKRLIDKDKLSQQVYVLPNERIVEPDVVDAFDIFCAPSRQEGLGLSIMEAMGKRVPVIASEVGGIPQLISNHESGLLFSPQSPDALTQAALKMYQDRELRSSCAREAFKKASQLFSLDRMIDSTIESYEKTSQDH